MDPVSLAVTLGGISAAGSALGAKQQNDAISKSQQSVRRSQRTAQDQQLDRAQQLRRETFRDAAIALGASRASAASRGVGLNPAIARANSILLGQNLEQIHTRS